MQGKAESKSDSSNGAREAAEAAARAAKATADAEAKARQAVVVCVRRVLWVVVQVGESNALGAAGPLEVEGLLEWVQQLGDTVGRWV